MGDVSDKSYPKSVSQKLFIKSVGERDMGIQELMHKILSLTFCNSSFKIQTISLENSRRCEMTPQEITLQKSHLGIYANCELLFHGKELKLCNFIDFFAKYEIIGDKLIFKSKSTIFRIVPNFSSSPEGNSYDKYCKYQLLKY